MKILSTTGTDDIATVYVAQLEDGNIIEFVESVQPPRPRKEKWVLIISTLFGCPVKCRICDAGTTYRGKLSQADMFDQIDFLVLNRFPDADVRVEKFKIQFARMGEPAFNRNVLTVLEELPDRYRAPGLIPSVSSIAPHGTDGFFDRLLDIKRTTYANGRFQLQFSIHSTDKLARDWLVPVKKWSLEKIAQYGKKFFAQGDRKITLNFALAKNVPLEPDVLGGVFDPDRFLIKITPINPTYSTLENNVVSYINPTARHGECDHLLQQLREKGYDVILSIGELEENKIGSNCGQQVTKYLRAGTGIPNAYTYEVQSLA